jgi:hypothetical protein
MNNPLARQQVEFLPNLSPLVRIGRSWLSLNDRFPAACQFEVERNETRLILWDILLCKNRVNRAFHNAQLMQSSGSIAKKFGPSRNASVGHTSTQCVYLHLMQLSVTTNVM